MKNQQPIEATLLFLLDEDKLLLAMKKRGFGAGLYNGVGGKIDPGETIEQAAIRECQEEIGVTPSNLKKMARLVFYFSENTTEPDMNVTTFTTTSWEGAPNETEEMAPKWFSLTDIPYDQMWEDDPYWLPIVLAGKPIHGKFVFDKDNHLLSASVKNTR